LTSFFDSLNGIFKPTSPLKKNWRLSQQTTVVKTRKNVRLRRRQGKEGNK